MLLYSLCILSYCGLVQGFVVNAYPDIEDDDLTCWTCPNMTDNESCNKWAPDIKCSTNHTICQTVHQLDTHTGKTIRVYKRCALPAQCRTEHIGCEPTSIPHVQECTSCCDTSLCNKHAPTNYSSAMQMSSIGGSRTLHAVSIYLLTVAVLCGHTLKQNV